MLRPERMSRASIIFLKSDSESVVDALNRNGAFHLTLKDVERSESADLRGAVIDLSNRIRNAINKIDALAPPAKGEGAPAAEGEAVQASDWQSFIRAVNEELSPHEQRIREVESRVQQEAKDRPVYELWKAFAGALGATGLRALSGLKRVGVTVLHAPSAQPQSLRGALPQSSVLLPVSSKPAIAVVLSLREDGEEVLHAAESLGYTPLKPLEGMPQDYSELPGFLSSYGEALERAKATIGEDLLYLKRLKPRLAHLSRSLSDAHSVLSIREKAALENSWSLVEGYVPTRQTGSLVNELNSRLNGRMIPFFKEEHSSREVPVTFRYPRYMKLFETITNLYGVPSYTEVNPTPILALTFPIFFGLMFGDVGHGLMLIGLGAIMYKYTQSMKKIGKILIVCGIFGALVGASLYGEAFGQHLPYAVPFPTDETNIMSIFTLSLVIGVSQISLGMFIAIANRFIQRRRAEAFLVDLPRMLFYWAGIYLVVTYGINFDLWLTGPVYIALTPLLLLIAGKPVFMIAKHGIREGLAIFGEMGFDAFDTMIRFISNTISYLRIFAMVMAHVQLIGVFYTLSEIVAGGSIGIIVSPLLIIAGNVFVVLLESILAVAQDLRLHFYEWFSRFYEDGGVRFTPFKLAIGVPVRK